MRVSTPQPTFAGNRVASPILQTERLILRPPTPADAPAIVEYYTRNAEFLAPWEPSKPRDFYTVPFWERQARDIQREFEHGSAVRFFLFPSTGDTRVIGYVSYTQIVRRAAQYCVLGYSLGADCEGHGLMTEALRESIRWVFQDLGLHRISANYMPHNRRSGNVLRRLGFAVEGYARDYLFINGRWEDHVLAALINPAWQAS
jgi:ribosomal-protein-alanine N-acetyltransferase